MSSERQRQTQDQTKQLRTELSAYVEEAQRLVGIVDRHIDGATDDQLLSTETAQLLDRLAQVEDAIYCAMDLLKRRYDSGLNCAANDISLTIMEADHTVAAASRRQRGLTVWRRAQ